MARYDPEYHITEPKSRPSGYHGYYEWERRFANSSAYVPGDYLIGVSACYDSLGGTMIRLDIRRDNRIITFSPYYNQYAYDNPDGDYSELWEVQTCPREWLSNMSMATDWHNGDWHELGSCPAHWRTA